MQTEIRFVRDGDIPGILEIYRPYVEDTNISWEEACPSLEEFTKRVEGIRQRYPYLVCERDGQVGGYAYASRLHERSAWRYAVSVSAYLYPDFHGRGMGSALYEALFALLGELGYYTAFAYVVSDNAKSLGMHRKCGFVDVGVHRRAGYKLGGWHDVTLMQRDVGDYEKPPGALRTPDQLDPEMVRRHLDRAARLLRG